MKIQVKPIKPTTRTFNDLQAGVVYKTSSGYYYMKVSGPFAVNVASGELHQEIYFVGTNFHIVDAELVVAM